MYLRGIVGLRPKNGDRSAGNCCGFRREMLLEVSHRVVIDAVIDAVVRIQISSLLLLGSSFSFSSSQPWGVPDPRKGDDTATTPTTVATATAAAADDDDGEFHRLVQ